MPLSQREIAVLEEAGSTPSAAARQEAAEIFLGTPPADRNAAAALLARGYRDKMGPAFHLIARGGAVEGEAAFTALFEELVSATKGFTSTEREVFVALLRKEPGVLAPLRMILGLTRQEMTAALRIVNKDARTSTQTLRKFEQGGPPTRMQSPRRRLIEDIATAVTAIMERRILQVPDRLARDFHSNLDKRDTIDGWRSVAESLDGVPYSALLYQRYVGGVWRQVQDRYSEAKGDALLEQPFMELLGENGIGHHRTGPGWGGSKETKERYGLDPAPDFVIPASKPTLAVDAKVGEDVETVVDKADQIEKMASAASAAGLRPCAVIEGYGWVNRTNALARVMKATEGRTYTLATLDQFLDLPEVAALPVD